MSKQAVLYVEDDNFSRDVMEILFDEYPEYELIMFENSHDFPAKVEQLPDNLALVLLDIHVEPYNGFKMLQMIRQNKNYSHIPILALTASVMSEEITQLRTSGFDGAIAKPIDQDYFFDHIRDALNGKLVWLV